MMQRIIGFAGGREDCFSGTAESKQSGCDGMRSIYKMRTYQSGFRTKHTGINLFERLAAKVIISISCCPRKTGFRNAKFLKSVHHTLCISFADLLQQSKLRCRECLCTACKIIDFRFDF